MSESLDLSMDWPARIQRLLECGLKDRRRDHN